MEDQLTDDERKTLFSYCSVMKGGHFEPLYERGFYIIRERIRYWDGRPDKLVTAYMAGSMSAIIRKMSFHIENQDNEL